MSGIQVAPDIEERHGFPGALRASPSPAVFAVGARATAAAAAARTRGPRAARAARRGLVHADHAPVERGAVERGDGLLRLLGGRHLDEAEAPRASRLSVGHHGGRHHLAEAREGAAQALARGGKRETTDEQLHGHDLLLSFAGSITPSIYPPRNGDLDEMARLFGADLTESLSRSGLRRWGRAAANRPRSARARRARPAQRSHAPAA